MDNSIVIYQSGDGKTHLEVKYEEDTLWLSQQQICDLYQTSKSNVSEHIKHIFEDGELKEESASHGKSRNRISQMGSEDAFTRRTSLSWK